MLAPNGLSAPLSLSKLPLRSGAADIVQQGLRASLYPANKAALEGVMAIDEATPAAVLLCDPQTAGGFLAAIPTDKSADVLDALQKQGITDAAIVGHVHECSENQLPITLTD